MKETEEVSKRNKVKKIAVAVVVAVLVLLGATGALRDLVLSTGWFDSPPPTEISGPFITDEIRAIPLSDNTGEVIRLGDFDGQVLHLTYWASWCTTCRQTNPTIETLSRTLSHRDDISFLLLSMDNVQESALQYLERGRFTIPNTFPEGPLPAPLQGRGIPTTYVIDKSGQIVYRHTGYANYATRAFQEWIEQVADRGD